MTVHLVDAGPCDPEPLTVRAVVGAEAVADVLSISELSAPGALTVQGVVP